MHYISEIFQDPTFIKSSKWTIIGTIIGSIGLDTVDIYTRVILQCCGIVAFIATFVITLPKIIDLITKILKIFKETGSKVLKAIRTTYKNENDN